MEPSPFPQSFITECLQLESHSSVQSHKKSEKTTDHIWVDQSPVIVTDKLAKIYNVPLIVSNTTHQEDIGAGGGGDVAYTLLFSYEYSLQTNVLDTLVSAV